MNTISELNLTEIVERFYRRKALIIAVFLVVSLLASYLAFVIPNVYRSSTLIAVTPQRVPSSFVTSTVTLDLNDRMQAIVQEILSRPQLEMIINEFHLSSPDISGTTMEDRIESLRKKVSVESRRNAVFELSFDSRNAETAKQVTSRLAAVFIDQNLKVREQQAMGTKSFINAEAERLRKELEEQEVVVNRYKAAHLYELPDQLETNLRSLEQYRRELEAGNQRLAALEERKGVLQKQSVESDILGLGVVSSESNDGTSQNIPVELKKKELESLLQKYSDKHPDVIRVRKEIQSLEARGKAPTSAGSPNINPIKQVLQKQVTDLTLEIQSLRSQQDRLRAQIAISQARVDNSPMRAIELSKISRGYDITLKKYQDLLAKGLESELSENMEKKLKGEQFQILDPANFPLKPLKPNRPMIILFGIFGGLAAGLALAFVWDNVDTSFKRSDELAGFVNIPLLATIPSVVTRGSVLDQRRANGVLVFASIAVLAVGLVCVQMFGPLYF